jgi:hypothetical protein
MSESVMERPAIIEKIIHTTFELATTKQSQWLKEGTGPGTNLPAKKLHHSKVMFIPVYSRLYLGKGKGYRETAYVIGANTHYVEDYCLDKNGELVLDPIKNAKEADDKGYSYHLGLRSQGFALNNTIDKWSAETRKSMGLSICFEDGRLELSKYGDDPVLLRFIMEHEQNKFAPRAQENRDPSRLKLFMFQPLIRENKAAKAKIVETFDDSLDAMTFVGKLRTKTEKGYIFDEAQLDAVLNILEDGIGLAPGEVNQKFEIVARAAKTDGRTFMSIINGTMNDLRMEVGTANTLDVLTYTATDAKLTIEGKKGSIYTFKKGTEKAGMVDELILYFLSGEKGKNDYNEMKRQTEIAKIAATTGKNK